MSGYLYSCVKDKLLCEFCFGIAKAENAPCSDRVVIIGKGKAYICCRSCYAKMYVNGSGAVGECMICAKVTDAALRVEGISSTVPLVLTTACTQIHLDEAIEKMKTDCNGECVSHGPTIKMLVVSTRESVGRVWVVLGYSDTKVMRRVIWL